MATRQEAIIFKIAADTRAIRQAMAQAAKSTKKVKGRLADMNLMALKGKLAFTAIGYAAFRFGKSAFEAFRQAELGITKVGKTSNIYGKQLRALQDDILAIKTPAMASDLFTIAEVAGQLGIKGRRNIASFTEVVSKLGFATNVVGQEGATSMARLLELTGDGVEGAEAFANALVHLGNNAKASEAEILHHATALGRKLILLKPTANQVAALGATYAELGANVEASSTAMGKAGLKMKEAFSKGGDAAKLFARVMGLSMDEAIKLFDEDAFGALTKFMTELGKFEDSSEILNALALGGDRIKANLLPLATRSEVLTKNLRNANQASREKIALDEETNRLMGITDGHLKTMSKEWEKFNIAIGEEFVKGSQGSIKGMAEMSKGLQYLGRDAGKAMVNTLGFLNAIGKFAANNTKTGRLISSPFRLLARNLKNRAEDEEARQERAVRGVPHLLYAAGLADDQQVTVPLARKKQVQFPFRPPEEKTDGEEEAEKETAISKEEDESLAYEKFRVANELYASEKELEEKKIQLWLKSAAAKKAIEEEGQRRSLKLQAAGRKAEITGIHKKIKEELKLEKKAVEGRKVFQNAMVGLLQHQSKKVRAIAAAHALKTLALDAKRGVVSAYTWGNKLGGPIGGLAAAAVAGAWYLMQGSQLKEAARLNKGGKVPGLRGANRDSVLINATPGETVIPRDYSDEVMSAVAREKIRKKEAPAEGRVTNVNLTVEGNVYEGAEQREHLVQMLADAFNINNLDVESYG